jgi:UDP-glucose 4-epimerase
MTILLTGSSGHLGQALALVLREQGHEVRGLDLLPSAFTQHTGDLSDPEFTRNHMQGVEVVMHAATLHKPHVATHSRRQFVDSNVLGTLNLLEAALAQNVKAFLFTSTTSAFGDALAPAADAPAAWTTEALASRPKNIYGATKTAAEDLCQLFHRNEGLPCIVLRTSRFFLEQDDDPELRQAYEDENIKANEFLYRRVDIADVVDAHLCALERANEIGFGKYVISATTPFQQSDLLDLHRDAPAVLRRYFPAYEAIYAAKGWKMFPKIGRVYVNALAREELGWRPRYDFQHVLNCLQSGEDFFSPLAREVGVKGYHAGMYEDGLYPV